MGASGQPPPGTGWSHWSTAGFRVDAGDGCVVVAAYGEVDVDTLPGLLQALRTAAEVSARLVVDLTHVTFIDASGVGVLLATRSGGRSTGGSLGVVNPPAAMRKLLAAHHELQEALPVFDSLQQAVEATRATDHDPAAEPQ